MENKKLDLDFKLFETVRDIGNVAGMSAEQMNEVWKQLLALKPNEFELKVREARKKKQ